MASKYDLNFDDRTLNIIPGANYLPDVRVRLGFLLF